MESVGMTTPLEKTLNRELPLQGRRYIVAISPDGLKLTLKGKRKGKELRWIDLVNGDAALAVALNASLGTLESSGGGTGATQKGPGGPKTSLGRGRNPRRPGRK
jgi:hypothetical protein